MISRRMHSLPLLPIIYAVLLSAIYFSTYSWLLQVDWPREDYNYCYLIPVVVAYLIWEKRKELAAVPARMSWSGLLLIVPGVLLFGVGELSGEFYSSYVSSWLIVVGLLASHLGWRKIRVLMFPVFFALAMFPLPNVLNNKIMLNLKLISSQLGVALIQFYGLSAYREGNIIDLGFTQLQVVDACSGLRYVMPLMVLSLILAYWYRASLWKRIFLFLSSIPVAIFSNSLRIALTGILYSLFGSQVAEGFFHGFSGWLIFMFALPFFLIEMWILKRLPPKEIPERGNEDTVLAAAPPDIAHAGIDDRRSAGGGPVRAKLLPITLVLVLGGMLASSWGIDFHGKIPIKKDFGQFPTTVGEWSGLRETMEPEFTSVLKFTDYIIVNYRNKLDQTVNFYVAYYQDQQKGGSIHSPETCLPGSGWLFKDSGEATVAISKDKGLVVSRALMTKSGVQQLTYYWFPQRGRVLTNIYQLKLYALWDALTKQRTDGSLVRAITPVYPNETLKDAEARLQGFVRQINPLLDEFLPGEKISR